MAITKLSHHWSMASDRAFVVMAKTMDLNAIAKKTGRQRESILKTAMRLGVSIKGRKVKGK
jgi:predicted RNA-binding protein with PUA-like domain